MQKKAGATENFDFNFCGSASCISVLVYEPIDNITFGIDNGHIEGYTAIQAVRGTAQSRIIGAYGHLHFIQDSLIIVAVFDKLCGRLFDR